TRTFPVRDAEGKCVRIVGVVEDITLRADKDLALKEAHEKLRATLTRLSQQTRNNANLAELVDILQSCQSAEEAYGIIRSVLRDLLPSTSGGVFISSPLRDSMEMVATWGAVVSSAKTFRPDDCWALRRGKIHHIHAGASPLLCPHVSKAVTEGY